MTVFQRIKTAPDSNGNPRGLYVFYGIIEGMASADPSAIYEEGYHGFPQGVDRSQAVQISDVTVSVSEYREWVRLGKTWGIYHPD